MTPQERFCALVSSYERTTTWPTQIEGQLADGRVFYFRFRSGFASLGLGHDLDAAYVDELDHVLAWEDPDYEPLPAGRFQAAFLELWDNRIEDEKARAAWKDRT